MVDLIVEEFPTKLEGKTDFLIQSGFKKGAIYRDYSHFKVIGYTFGFKLPKDSVQVTKVGETDDCIKYGVITSIWTNRKPKFDKGIKDSLTKLLEREDYVSRNFMDLSDKINALKGYERLTSQAIIIAKCQDATIRQIIPKPLTYARFLEGKSAWPITYVGEKRVILCAPVEEK